MRNGFFLILSFGLENASAQTPKPKSISAGVVNGKAKSLPKPEYPASETSVDKLIDETAVKTKLLKMRDSIETAPPDFPPDVHGKFKEIVKFADARNLNSVENKNRFLELVIAALNIISPDSLH